MNIRTLRHHIPALRRLSRAKSKHQRSKLVRRANRSFINAVCSCAHNSLRGNVPFSNKQKTKLRKHKKHIKSLLKHKSLGAKRRLLIQRGCFLGPLLAGALTIIPNLISGILGKN